jgi:hypothetical protein
MKIQDVVFCVMTPRDVQDTNVSEDHAATIFTSPWQWGQYNTLHNPEDYNMSITQILGQFWRVNSIDHISIKSIWPY